MTIFACVLKSGGIYGPHHVAALQRQLPVPLTCFTDMAGVQNAVPLRWNLPGWWAKMELFAPHVHEDIVYFDLDTVIQSPPSILFRQVTQPCMLRDFYRYDGLQSSIMVIPQGFKAYIWKRWSENPYGHMSEFQVGGDQVFLESCGKQFWTRLQDLYPGEYVSWKVDAVAGTAPTANVIVFHGQPKPWDIPDEQAFWRR